MGFFDSKWIVEFEYSDSFIGSYKKSSMVVEAASEYSAKDKAKSVLKANHKYVRVLSAHKSGGKAEERNTSYKPTYTSTVRETPSYSAPISSSEHHESRAISKEEMAEMERKIAERRAEVARIEKKNKITAKEREIKNSPVRNMIIGYFASLGAFLLGWIPHWVLKAMENSARISLQMWIDLGHSASDSFGQELTAEISQRQAAANGTLWIPFAMLGIGIVISIVLFFMSKKKVPAKLNEAQKELDLLKSN